LFHYWITSLKPKILSKTRECFVFNFTLLTCWIICIISYCKIENVLEILILPTGKALNIYEQKVFYAEHIK
jgi:hypothetical protein